MASELISSLFSVGRNPHMTVEEVAHTVIFGDGGSYSAPEHVLLLLVIQDLCNNYLCPWLHLSQEDCGRLRMQILFDVY